MLTEYCMLTSSRGIDCTTAISPREGAHPNSESLQVLQPFNDFTSTRRKRKRKKSHGGRPWVPRLCTWLITLPYLERLQSYSLYADRTCRWGLSQDLYMVLLSPVTCVIYSTMRIMIAPYNSWIRTYGNSRVHQMICRRIGPPADATIGKVSCAKARFLIRGWKAYFSDFLACKFT